VAEFFFQSGDGWELLPSWARFFQSVGENLGARQLEETRTVVGVALPTRAYAATLSSVGVVLARARFPVQDAETEEHFEMLCALPLQTTVYCFHKDKRKTGIFRGVTEYRGEPHIRVQFEKRQRAASGGQTILIGQDECLLVRPAKKDTKELPKRQTGRYIASNVRFLQRALEIDDVREFATNSRLDCMVFGRVGVLGQEILQTQLSVREVDAGKPAQGRFQDLLRVRRFAGEGNTFRSEITASGGRSGQPEKEPHVAIFDGVSGFINWQHLYPTCHWIVILDRTAPNLEDAASILREEYRARERETTMEVFASIPDGAELLCFEMRRA